MLLRALLVAAFFSASLANFVLDEKWEEFKTRHGRVYPSREIEAMRKAIFKHNYVEAEKHDDPRWTVDPMNLFGDMVRRI